MKTEKILFQFLLTTFDTMLVVINPEEEAPLLFEEIVKKHDLQKGSQPAPEARLTIAQIKDEETNRVTAKILAQIFHFLTHGTGNGPQHASTSNRQHKDQDGLLRPGYAPRSGRRQRVRPRWSQ